MPIEIVCPSGLTGKIRGLKAREADMLADKQAAAKGTNIEDVLRNCWLETIDPGVYAAGLPSWNKVLYCDRYYTLFQVSRTTFGDAYPFDVQCTNPRCGEPIEWEVQLSALPLKPLPEASRVAIKAGQNRFETAAAGRKVWFRLLDGQAEKDLAELMRANPKKQIVTAAAGRIVEIEGLHFNDRFDFVEDLELEELQFLMDRFDAADGGLETKLQVSCKCNWRSIVDLPLEGLLVRRRRKAA